jgi:hypothetical protein
LAQRREVRRAHARENLCDTYRDCSNVGVKRLIERKRRAPDWFHGRGTVVGFVTTAGLMVDSGVVEGEDIFSTKTFGRYARLLFLKSKVMMSLSIF